MIDTTSIKYMKAAVLYHPGQAENFIIEKRLIPEPNENEVLVKVKAFGLNRSELMTRERLISIRKVSKSSWY